MSPAETAGKQGKEAFLLLTLGDPNGLGPELACLIGDGLCQGSETVLLLGAEQALAWHCRHLGRAQFWTRLQAGSSLESLPGGIFLIPPPEAEGLEIEPGKPSPKAGKAALAALDLACRLLRQMPQAALVTCPVDKSAISQAGYEFSGHTEYLALQFGLDPEEVCMHLAGDKLRVSLATTHHPLRRVADLLTRTKIERCLRLTWKLVSSLGCASAPIGVCGLNPHAGESGWLGDEEQRVIAPAVERMRGEGVSAAGPIAADTLFYRALQGEFSAILAMYHDQGLGPLKMIHFEQAVNVTLGLPVVRTSVGHGTGYDQVGRGGASRLSLSRALETARLMRDAPSGV